VQRLNMSKNQKAVQPDNTVKGFYTMIYEYSVIVNGEVPSFAEVVSIHLVEKKTGRTVKESAKLMKEKLTEEELTGIFEKIVSLFDEDQRKPKRKKVNGDVQTVETPKAGD